MILSINHSFDSFHNLKDTKTAAGRRALPLTEAFRAHREAQRSRGRASIPRSCRFSRDMLPALSP